MLSNPSFIRRNYTILLSCSLYLLWTHPEYRLTNNKHFTIPLTNPQHDPKRSKHTRKNIKDKTFSWPVCLVLPGRRTLYAFSGSPRAQNSASRWILGTFESRHEWQKQEPDRNLHPRLVRKKISSSSTLGCWWLYFFNHLCRWGYSAVNRSIVSLLIIASAHVFVRNPL